MNTKTCLRPIVLVLTAIVALPFAAPPATSLAEGPLGDAGVEGPGIGIWAADEAGASTRGEQNALAAARKEWTCEFQDDLPPMPLADVHLGIIRATRDEGTGATAFVVTCAGDAADADAFYQCTPRVWATKGGGSWGLVGRARCIAQDGTTTQAQCTSSAVGQQCSAIGATLTSNFPIMRQCTSFANHGGATVYGIVYCFRKPPVPDSPI